MSEDTPKPTREELVKRLVETLLQLFDVPLPQEGVTAPRVMPRPDDEQLLKIPEASKRFGVSTSFFYGARDLPFVMKLPGSGYRVHPGKLRAWLEEETARKAQRRGDRHTPGDLPEWVR